MTKYYKEVLRPKGGEIETMYWKVDETTTVKLYNSLSEFGWEVYRTDTEDFDWDEVSEITGDKFKIANKEVLDRINNFRA